MKLTELRIKNFGGLKDHHIVLKEGINLIYGPNESGKTTLHTFIRAMLYGITRKRGRASRNDLYSRYEPWDNSSSYAGVLKFESGGKIFRINRSFYKGSTSEELICETDGEKLSIEHDDLRVLMGNVSENAFENTVFIGQMRSQTDSTLYDELRNYIANYEGASDGSLDIGKAQNLLKVRKKEFESRKKDKTQQQETQRKEITNKMEYIQEELQNYKDRLTQVSEAIRGYQKPVSEQDQQPWSNHSKPILLYAAVLAVLIFLIGILQSSVWFKGGGILLSLLCLSVGFLMQLKPQKQQLGQANDTRTASFNDDRKHLLWKQEQLQEQCEEKAMALQNLQEDYQEFCETISGNRALEEELQGIQLAMDTIEAISAGMQIDVEKEIRAQISSILNELTQGRYTAVDITRDQNIALNMEDRCIPLEQTSKGTIEQVYFSLRMSISRILCSQESLPVFLDDVFAMYDEVRLKAALRWLADNKEQTLIFTCHRREEELLRATGLKYNKIEL